MSVWLVRHAQPVVEPGVCYGATDLPALALATNASAQALARELPRDARVMTSPLRRCLQLALELQRLRADLPHGVDARLAEMDFGAWEGWRWDAIPKSAIDQWTERFGDWRFGGRESVQELMNRVASAWAEARATTRPTVWITHAGVIRAATLLSKGVSVAPASAQWPRDAPAFGQCLRLP